MEELSPESKALYELLMIDTREEYEKRFLDYKKKVLDAMKSTAPLRVPSGACFREPCPRSTPTSTAASPSSDITRNGAATPATVLSSSSASAPTPDASRVVLNAKRDSSKDDLSPGARRVYDYIVGNSEEYVPVAASTSTSSTSMVALASPPASVLSATATNETDPSSVMPATCSTVCLVEIGDIQEAVDLAAADLAVPAPTTCSVECPSHDDDVAVSVIILSTTSNSSTIICDAAPEQAAPAFSDKVLDVDVMGDITISAAICFPCGPGHNTGGEDAMSMFLTLWSPPTSCNTIPGYLSSPPRPSLDVLQQFEWSATTFSTIQSGCSTDAPPSLMAEGYKVFNDVLAVTAIVPWPPPSFTLARTPLIRGQVLCHDAQQKRGKECLVSWDSKGNWNAIWVDVELKPPWFFHGACMNLPIGNLLSSLGFLIVNDNNNPCTNWCLDDVLWKLPRCWSYSQWVQPANEILDVCFWLWVTSKHAEAQFQFSCPLLPVSGHFARLYFPLSRRAQMNVQSNCGTSVNWFVYGGYTVLNTAYTCSWMFLIAGHLPPYGHGAGALLFLTSWLHVHRLQFCVVQGYPSSNGFPAMLVEEAVVQQRYTSTRVLIVDVPTRWICHQILQGNTNYSEHMQWLFCNSLLQSQCWFCTPGHILFFCCALEQSEKSWTIRLVPLKSGLQCYRAGRKCLYTSGNFQWTIAWSLGYHFSLSVLQLRQHCAFLLMQLNCPAIYQEIWFRIMIAKPIGSLDLALTEWKPWISGVYFWSTYLGASTCGRDVPILSWLQFALQNSRASQEEFQFSIKIGKLHDILVELDIYTRSMHYLEYFEWQIPCYNCDREFLEAFLLSAHPPSKALQLSWDPGDCDASAWSRDKFGRLDATGVNWNSSPLPSLRLTWDPGDSSRHRLEGKPDFKRGGLSTTCLHGLAGGPRRLVLGLLRSHREAYIYQWSIHYTTNPCIATHILQRFGHALLEKKSPTFMS